MAVRCFPPTREKPKRRHRMTGPYPWDETVKAEYSACIRCGEANPRWRAPGDFYFTVTQFDLRKGSELVWTFEGRKRERVNPGR